MLRFGEAGEHRPWTKSLRARTALAAAGGRLVDLYIRGPNRAALEPRRVVVELSADENRALAERPVQGFGSGCSRDRLGPAAGSNPRTPRALSLLDRPRLEDTSAAADRLLAVSANSSSTDH
jgi:hypothetical protein